MDQSVIKNLKFIICEKGIHIVLFFLHKRSPFSGLIWLEEAKRNFSISQPQDWACNPVTSYNCSLYLSSVALFWVEFYLFYLLSSLFNSCLALLVEGILPENRVSGCFNSGPLPRFRGSEDTAGFDQCWLMEG